MKLVFATNNTHKIKEVEKMLPEGVNLLKLKDIDCFDDLPETGTTLMDNARQKARYIYEKFGLNCFADDSGIYFVNGNNLIGIIFDYYGH